MRTLGGEVAAWADRLGVTVSSIQKAIMSHKTHRKIPVSKLNEELIKLYVRYDAAKLAFTNLKTTILLNESTDQASESISIEQLLDYVHADANPHNEEASDVSSSNSSTSSSSSVGSGISDNDVSMSVGNTTNSTNVEGSSISEPAQSSSSSSSDVSRETPSITNPPSKRQKRSDSKKKS
jgi:sugar diacid utilization regulator